MMCLPDIVKHVVFLKYPFMVYGIHMLHCCCLQECLLQVLPEGLGMQA